ncbi:hypothetical protein CYMTET_51379 [Cymbomonas tetramitiformis]|uniref:Transmembrane protein n=1 Tax=Cymbomonas tetramitiformis TaxID=36881 RepID=A0AAE0BLB6_9CHLO|nr:hypothetical protein CYMTET_51379 [Cymbomonas tetramitiformis]
MLDDNDDHSNEEDDTKTVYDAPRSVVSRHSVCRGGALPPSFRTAMIPVCIAALFCLCATAAPLAGQALGGAQMNPFGDMPSDTGDDAVPADVPPRKQIRYRQEKQGFYRWNIPVLGFPISDSHGTNIGKRS